MLHLGRERLHHGGEAMTAIIDLRDFRVGLAGEMDELNFLAVGVPHRGRLVDELIDAVRALAAAHDEHDGQRGIESKFFRSDGAIDPRQAAPHGRASDDAVRATQVIRTRLEAEQRLVDHRRDVARDAAGNCIRLVNDGRQTKMPAEQQRDRASKAAHADNGGGLKIAIDLAALAPTADERHAEGKDARCEQSRPADARQRLRFLLGRALERDGVDLLG